MPPIEAQENLIVDVILPVLQGIGTPPTNWLTAPTVVYGIPGDSIEPDTLFLAPLTCVFNSEDDELDGSGFRGSATRVHFALWAAAKDVRTAFNLLADGRRALWAASASLQAVAEYGADWIDSIEIDLERSRAGFVLALMKFHASPVVSRTA